MFTYPNFRISKFSYFCVENMNINFLGQQRPQKTVPILCREN